MKNLRLLMIAGVAVFALTLAGCGGGGGSATAPADTPPMTDPAGAQRTAIDSAIMAAQSAVGMVDDMADDAAVTAAEDAIAAARQAIADAAGLPAAEKTAHGGTVSALETTLNAAMTSRTAYMTKVADEARTAMMATAAKLYTAIGDDPLREDNIGFIRFSAITSDDGVLQIANRELPGVNDIDAADRTSLKEDKTATVAPLHGWAGSRHSTTANTGAGAGTYTAHIYGNIEASTPGAKFNAVYTAIDANGVVAIGNAAGQAGNTASKIVSPQFDHRAGVKSFKLPDPNPAGERIVTIDGSYDGVAGVYSCNTGTAGTAGTNTCSVTKASGDGYTLTGSGAWSFKPANPEDTLAPTPDTVFAVYGWWLHEAPDGAATVAAIAISRGALPAVSGLSNVYGTATYTGGAAGKYALQSSTGGTNDAGHFTADAELTANFTDNTITGTIDNFMGSDGMARDWSVALKENGFGGTGFIPNTGDGAPTTWTINGSAASDSGSWVGRFNVPNDGGVPKVATGRFYSEYGRASRMVGSFGTKLQE